MTPEQEHMIAKQEPAVTADGWDICTCAFHGPGPESTCTSCGKRIPAREPSDNGRYDPNCPKCHGTGCLPSPRFDPPEECDCWDRHQPADDGRRPATDADVRSAWKGVKLAIEELLAVMDGGAE